MRLRIATVIFLAGSSLAFAQQPAQAPQPAAPAAPPSVGAGVDTPISAEANRAAGQGCPATSAGMPRLVTRGEGPVVMHSGSGAGQAGRSDVTIVPGTTTTDHCN